MTTILAPSHLLAFSTLLGAQLHQTFLVTSLNFTHLPRPAFKTLQKAAFPAYFRAQTVLVVLTVVTGPAAAGGLLGLVGETGSATTARAGATWDSAALGVALATALANWLVYSPRTIVAMDARTRLETRAREKEKKKQIDQGEELKDGDSGENQTELPIVNAEASPELKAAARNFSRNHAMSIHLNLITIIATLVYGWGLAGRMSFS
ncbi:hypothetical protein LTR84_005951 [Exophiala bonariae]|uniref:TMEM205-like domain-containing protein n=1 Tax=Exophiala bonariae TaxID=1690606 RepID=A0AAV9N6H2_9EURO|nr:hypothetical protein LTR84_005951 [Exophiala bonariae]